MSDITQKLVKVCQAIEGKKGEDILVLDISQVSSFTDFFILCHGNNEKQIQAICDAIREVLAKEEQTRPALCGGLSQRHMGAPGLPRFRRSTFSQNQPGVFYNLEKLWSDGTEGQSAGLVRRSSEYSECN